MLRIIAGLEAVDGGSVAVGGKKVCGVGGERGIVIQEPRLLLGLTVRQNVSLGLELRCLPRPAIDQKVEEFLDLVGLGQFSSAYPGQFPGVWRNGSVSPEHWPPIRKFYCSTNRLTW